MTPSEFAAFHAGIRHAAEMALVTAITIEVRSDARQVRQRAAIEALRGLADGLKASLPGEANSTQPVEPTLSAETTDPIESGLSAPAGTEPPKEVLSPEAGTANPASLSDRRHASIAAGYSGDPCPSCQNFTLERSGTCLVCETCGSTTGCS